MYDADGGLLGELRYVVGRAAGRTHCDLCEITHGAVRPKRGWIELTGRLPVPVRVVHRNERSDEVLAASDGTTPCVLARRDGALEVALGPEELRACGGDVAELERRLRAVLAAG